MRRAATGSVAVVVVGCLLASTSAAQTVESGAHLGTPPAQPSRSAASAESAPAESVPGAVDSSDPDSQSPRLIVLTSDRTNATGLLGMLRTQLPGWQVQLRDEPPGMLALERLQSELRARDALLWFEAAEAVVHVVIQGHEGQALSSPIPIDAADPERSRVYALAAVGLLTELSERRLRMAAYEDSVLRIRERQLDELREQREEDARRIERLTRSQEALRAEMASLERRSRSRWRSPLAPSGWSLRLGWVNGFSPDHDFHGWPGGTNPSVFAFPTAGLRLSLGHRLADRFQVGGALVTLHARGLWNGSVSAFASVHSRTRFRVGISGEVGLLVARESGEYDDIDVSWGSIRFYLPLELGVVVNRHGGVFLKFGPLITRAPGGWFVGYDLSVEWEFD